MQCTAVSFLVCSAPLLEEERDICGKALVSNIGSPFGQHWSCAGAGFAADNDPIDAFEIDVWNWAQKRLKGNELDDGRRFSEVVYAEPAIRILHSDAHPHILRPGEAVT